MAITCPPTPSVPAGTGFVEGFLVRVDSAIGSFLCSSQGTILGQGIFSLATSAAILATALLGYRFIIGRASAQDGLTSLITIVIVFALLRAPTLFGVLFFNLLTDFPNEIGGAFVQAINYDALSAEATSPSITIDASSGSVSGSMDDFQDAIGELNERISRDSSGFFGGLIAAGAVLIISMLGWFLIAVALLMLTVAKIGLGIMLALAPFAVLSTLFTVTKPIFSKWLNQATTFAILPVLVYAVLALIMAVISFTFGTIQSQQGQTGIANISTSVGIMVLIVVISIYILIETKDMAGQLAGGMSLRTTGGAGPLARAPASAAGAAAGYVGGKAGKRLESAAKAGAGKAAGRARSVGQAIGQQANRIDAVRGAGNVARAVGAAPGKVAGAAGQKLSQSAGKAYTKGVVNPANRATGAVSGAARRSAQAVQRRVLGLKP